MIKVNHFFQFYRSRKQPVLGYTINYRREHGPWRQTDIHPLTGEMWLNSNMKCGTNYTIYMTSYNHVGPGHASSVMAAKTLGRVPDIPNPSDLLIVNKVLSYYKDLDCEKFRIIFIQRTIKLF